METISLMFGISLIFNVWIICSFVSYFIFKSWRMREEPGIMWNGLDKELDFVTSLSGPVAFIVSVGLFCFWRNKSLGMMK